MEIRQATIEDLPMMEEKAKEFYASSKFLGSFNMEKFITLWSRLIESGNGVIFSLTDGEGIQGAIGGVLYPEIYSDEIVATEFFWFVTPKHRGRGMDLYNKFEEWARNHKADQIRLAHLCDLMPDNLKWLYGEMGFTPIEINYAKELPR
jgi:RimJ/RimL family protein N-acetyltransferase